MSTKIICVANDTAPANSTLKVEHGLSYWIDTGSGIVMLDTGKSVEVLTHNLSQLGLEAGKVDALVISHSHYDHTGGLEALPIRTPKIPLYAHADVFRVRYSLRDGQYRPVGFSQSREEIEARFELILREEAVEVLPGLWTTGEIRQRAEAEGRSSNHFVKVGEEWQPDPYRDDLSLVLKTSRGLALICGCCHAGLLNTLWQGKADFKEPITTVIGGTHLMSAEGEALRHVIRELGSHFPGMRYYLNHCTGEEAITALQQAFGEDVQPCPAGTVIELED